MAETVRIEIPIEVQDNTDPELSNIVKDFKDVESAAKNVQNSVDRASEQVSKFDKSAEKTQKSLASWAKQKYELLMEAKDKASPILEKIKAAAKTVAGKTWSLTMKAIDLASVPIRGVINLLRNPLFQLGATLGVSIGFKDTVDTYAGFEAAMSQVKAISGASDSDFEELTEKAKQMGATTKYTATEAAEGFNYMAMAGWKTKDMLDGIEGIMSLAAASGEDLGTTSDIVTDALTAFGLKASDSTHFADVLAQAAASANTTVSGMGETFKYAGTLAGALGYSIEDVALATGLMANAGLKGSMAGTALNSIFTRLSTDTNGARKAIEELGVEFFESDGSARDLSDVLGELRKATAEMSAEQKSAFANTVAGTQAQKGLLAILNASEEDYNNLAEAINNADGASANMAETMLDNLQGSFTLLQSAVDGVKISLGERFKPYLMGLADSLTEQMPDIEAGLNQFMDLVDVKAEEYKNKISVMVSSDDWKNADLFGKVSIAWDKIVGEPFTKWFSTKGKRTITGAISNLFSNAAKVLPGGQQADLSSWLSAGLILKTADPVVKGVSKITEALSSLSPVAGKVGLAASLITAGITAIAIAVDNYNQKQIDNNLADHFGNISLSAAQAANMASGILGIDYMVEVNYALSEFNNADELRKKAEDALAANNVLEWKCSVGLSLTEDEQQDYKSNIDTFVQSSLDELESRTYAVNLSIKTLLKTPEGDSLAAQVAEWAEQDQIDASSLSAQLTQVVETALEDGIINVNEQAAIDELQGKINNILSRWKESEAQAEMDWITQEYGSLSGKNLTNGSFTSVVSSLNEQRDTANAAIEELAKGLYTAVNANTKAGRMSESDSSYWKQQIGFGVRNEKARTLLNSTDFENNTMMDTYGAQINQNYSGAIESLQGNYENLAYNFQTGILPHIAYNLEKGAESMTERYGGTSKAEQGAMAEIYEAMKPDAQAMQDLVDEYIAMQQPIPQQIMDNFNEIMRTGAAAGDMDAAWNAYAAELVKPGNEALLKQIKELDPEVLPEEFNAALQRQLAETTLDPVELGELEAKVKDVEVDEDEKNRILTEAEQKVKDALEAGGNEVIATEQDLEVTLGDITVEKGDTLSQIAQEVGMTVQELAEYNNIADPNVINVGMVIKVPRESINVDESAAEEIKAAVEESTKLEETTTEAQTDITLTAGDTDYTAVQEAINAAGGDMDFSTLGSSVSNGVGTAITAADMSPITSAIATLKANVGSAIDAAFAVGFSTSTTVTITANYKLANPSATISFSGGGSGTATVSGSIVQHAAGGIMTSPHIGMVAEDGAEAIIPLGSKRRSRGLSLWERAGEILGVKKFAEGGIVGTPELSRNSLFDGIGINSIREALSNEARTYNGFSKGDNEDSSSAEPVPVKTENGTGEKTEVKVSVQMSPVFQISGENSSEESIMKIVRSHLKEMTDEIGGELAERLEMVFSNMPVRGGA